MLALFIHTTVKMFGEMEFWFAMIKIVAIVSLIVVGLVMVAMHFQSPTGVEASFAHLWNDGGSLGYRNAF